MKQILQNLKNGKTELVEVPFPQAKAGHLIVQTKASLISAGTERMLVDFGKANLLEKARQQPDKVRMVLDKVKTDGIIPAIETVRNKLDQPLPLGYSNVGIAFGTPSSMLSAQYLQPGTRIVSNGPHAEVICVPENLCARVPDNVSDEEASFTVLGAIALQGIRLAQPTLGERFVVIGLGLIGQITSQILMANGCKVLGTDFNKDRCDLAQKFGVETVDISRVEDPLESTMAFSNEQGVDGVLITAATKSSEPVHQAAQMCRKRGRIVLVGVTGLELSRSDFYEKELSFQVSCSYGPGRYDPEYEDKGHDYPIGFVRWTEQRNFEAVLDLMASGKLDVKPLITHRFPFDKAVKAYDMISENKEQYMGIVLNYGDEHKTGSAEQREAKSTIAIETTPNAILHEPSRPVVGLIGAGNFTGQVILPAIQKTNTRLKTIASSGGVSGTHLGKKFGFEESTTDTEIIFNDPGINTLFITTRHNTHAQMVIAALNAGKHVFVEKPLCLNYEELSQIQDIYNTQITDNNSLITSNGMLLLMVGFNRRFAPQVIKMKELMDSIKSSKSMIMTVNAGAIPSDHWTQDKEVGGGRIIGEVCHFIDLLRFLADSEIKSCELARMRSQMDDTVTINLIFNDGSIGTIHYFANGNRRFSKERLEVFCEGKILQLDNFRTLKGYGWKGFRKMNLWQQDKGHKDEIKRFIDAVKNGGSSPIPFDEILEVTRTTIELSKK